MSRYIDFLGRDGKIYRAQQQGEDNALPFIQKRIEFYMPIETVKVEDITKLINDVHVDFKRDITKEEAKQIIEVIKHTLIDEVDKMKKYYIDKEQAEDQKEH